MKTRNTDTPKAGATKKTPPVKKDAEKTPPMKIEAAESTPKASETRPVSSTAVKSAKSTGNTKQTTPKSAPKTETTPKTVTTPKADTKGEEIANESKSAGKKPVKKTKSPSAAKVPAANNAKAPTPKLVEAVKVEEKKELVPDPVKEVKDEVLKDSLKTAVVTKEPDDMVDVEEDFIEIDDGKDGQHEVEEYGFDEEMEDYGEQEGFQDPDDQECGEEELELDGEDGGIEDEQMQISALAKARRLKKEQEIFIGGLDRDALEKDVEKVFEKFGEIVEVRMHKNPLTNKNKGFAFVKFANKEQAARALSELKSPMIRGKRCGIAPSEDNDTLFLGNICNTWTKEAIKRKLKEYGVEGVENITLVGDTQNEGLSRGFAFVEFSCHEDAMLAYKRLQKPDVIFGHAERTAKVAFAEPIREPDAEVMAQVKSVFVDGLPPYWDEDRVKDQLKGYGEIERIVLARNMATAKRKDFGFVNFTTHEAALACIEGVNNTELGDDGKTKMKARARLANPLPKTQAVKGGMRGGFRIGRSGVGYSRFGRGFVRGRRPFERAGFQRGRGFHPRGRGRTGRFSYTDDNDTEVTHSEFRGRRPFGGRGGRRGSFGSTSGEERFELDRPRHGAQSRGYSFSSEGDFNRPFGSRHLGGDSYMYSDGGHGIKRPYSMMDHESSYLESGSRLRSRYDDSDLLSHRTRYRGTGSGNYSHDYYGSDYGGSTYSSLYGSGRSLGGGYYY
ncbi:uncharacterized protein LOC143864250 isoform X2 [Tasmannia lanceolata]|uniref:uncharacterized protein LOC143864250 isoform X2 n=1 Tax=Tasmannia lanceolata TaxID=3420 RepID=UPI0040632ED5